MSDQSAPGRRPFLTAALAAGLTVIAPSLPFAQEDPIVVGDLNSYTDLPAFTQPYRDGLMLAMEEINEEGGILGRQIRVISRDDGGNPGDAVTVANDLVRREGAHVLVGTILSHVGLAVSDFAQRRNVLFLAAEPLTDTIAWEHGNDQTFRLRPGTYVQAAMLAEEAAKLEATRWVTVAPNYEYGQSAVRAFKRLLKEHRPDVEFVGEQWPPLFKIDGGAVVQALAAEDPDAIFNVTFGPDLVRFVREGELRGLFEDREVVSVLTGEPEWMDPLGDQVPEGWIVTGYPWRELETPEHSAFREAYEERYETYPRMGSVVGYVSMYALAQAIEAAGSTETADILEAMRGMEVETPFGPVHFRSSDQQSTMGTFIGRTVPLEEGGGGIIDWHYVDGADYLPDEEAVRELRPHR